MTSPFSHLTLCRTVHHYRSAHQDVKNEIPLRSWAPYMGLQLETHVALQPAGCSAPERNLFFKRKLLTEPPLMSIDEIAIQGSAAAMMSAETGETMAHVNDIVEECTANMESLDVPDEIKLFMKVCPFLGKQQCCACLWAISAVFDFEQNGVNHTCPHELDDAFRQVKDDLLSHLRTFVTAVSNSCRC